MPITRDEWSKGRTADTIESRIEGFLGQNRGNAYAQSEIIDSIYKLNWSDLGSIVGSAVAVWIVGEALARLVREGKIQRRLVRKTVGEDYYYSIA